MNLQEAIDKSDDLVNSLDENGLVSYLKGRGLSDAERIPNFPGLVGPALGVGILIGLLLAEEEKVND